MTCLSVPLPEQLQAHAASKIVTTKMFEIPHDKQTYRVKILCDSVFSPRTGLMFHPLIKHAFPPDCRFFIASEKQLPPSIVQFLFQAFPKENTHIYPHDQYIRVNSWGGSMFVLLDQKTTTPFYTSSMSTPQYAVWRKEQEELIASWGKQKDTTFDHKT